MTFNTNIDRWHAMITPSDHSKPWILGPGGSWDMFDVKPIPDEMLAELAQGYHTGGTPWNCRSFPVSDADREWMYLLYYSMQGLVARMRQAEAVLAQTAQHVVARDGLRTLIADDAHAMSFQSLGQYRWALLKAIDAERRASAAATDQR